MTHLLQKTDPMNGLTEPSLAHLAAQNLHPDPDAATIIRWTKELE
jgi:hypothetical protein